MLPAQLARSPETSAARSLSWEERQEQVGQKAWCYNTFGYTVLLKMGSARLSMPKTAARCFRFGSNKGRYMTSTLAAIYDADDVSHRPHGGTISSCQVMLRRQQRRQERPVQFSWLVRKMQWHWSPQNSEQKYIIYRNHIECLEVHYSPFMNSSVFLSQSSKEEAYRRVAAMREVRKQCRGGEILYLPHLWYYIYIYRYTIQQHHLRPEFFNDFFFTLSEWVKLWWVLFFLKLSSLKCFCTSQL